MKNIILISTVLIVVVGLSMITYFPFGSSGINELEIDKRFSKVDVETENAKVIISPVNGDAAFVELSGNKNKYKLDANVKGDTLQIEVDDRWFRWFSFNLFSISSQPMLHVSLPQHQYESLEVTTDNGMIDASKLDTVDMKVETNNGKIALKHIYSSYIDAKADNGEIRMEDVEGEISSKTDNGQISLLTDSLDRPIEMKTDNGAIHILTTTEPTNVTFDIKVDNGKVQIFDESVYDTVIGDGDNLIKLTTDNGKITVGNS
ncbi:DUF4097 family beta strand repeat-containing protein [Oceanobacillus senegalensis]|uniref:DUF4097 family beta strand repeat-containing protein n=1 Tax=Oceanobacillus senegalensis TaxID=1936063 RepID=UPI0015C45574|nr:DUF4097 family beta strand repeat-containing protein [Oceanobacillus senegalensis]